jgi:3'-phosphoadenosine 5'-phosphosulfate (PAPS) 3'-phosphatase
VCCLPFHADMGQSPGGGSGRHWVLDPIDGTRGFVGQRQYAVCLGMLQDGEVVLGVLGCPNLPKTQATEADGHAGASDKGAADGAGCLFLAHR